MAADFLQNGSLLAEEYFQAQRNAATAPAQPVPQRVVLKFGGTVCGRLPMEVADICVSTLEEGPVAVVCSARSGKTKVEGTTNLLLKAVRDASKPGSTEYETIVADILRYHLDGTKILSQKRAASLSVWIHAECDKLMQYLSGLSASGGATTEAEDTVVSVGEKLSSKYMAALLEEKGIPAEYVDLSNIVDSKTTNAPTQEFYTDLAHRIGRRIEQCGKNVPVITGFFGMIPGGLLNACGRGYSDLLAALVAVGTNGRELQIWKEVSGVYTADPRKVPTATLLPAIHPSEANELTFYGSEVIHHYTIEQCIPTIPIRIKNVREPDGPGTLIYGDIHYQDLFHESRPRRPTAVTVKNHITVVNVHSHRKVGSPVFLGRIVNTLTDLAVDLLELNETHVSIAVHSQSPFISAIGTKDKEDIRTEHRNLQTAINELKSLGRVEVVENMAILSLIGNGLKRSVGMAGKLFTALGDNNINIEMISQGASEINISCVITERDSLRALNVVHTELFTFLDY